MAQKHNLVSISEIIFNLGIRLLIRVNAKNNILEEFYFFLASAEIWGYKSCEAHFQFRQPLQVISTKFEAFEAF